MDDKLKIYELLYKAYADEIKNLWQRSVFLGTFMVLVWTGYGALQLKFIEKCAGNAPFSYHLVSLGLCAVIIVLSLLWVAMAKGSKFVQEAHEWHMENLNFKEIKKDIKRLFCVLDNYEYPNFENLLDKQKKIMNSKCNGDLFLWDTLKIYRYSPSKINIALGWISLLISFILLNIHIFLGLDSVKEKLPNFALIITSKEILFIFVISFLSVYLIVTFIHCALKGNYHQIKYLKRKLVKSIKSQKPNSKQGA